MNMIEKDFVRYDAYNLNPDEINSAAEHLNLPYFRNFLGSIADAQTSSVNGTVRSYSKSLLTKGWFEIFSPYNGAVLRSGSSLILTDKTTIFSFPEEPNLLVGVGDLGLAFPISAILLYNEGLLIGVYSSDWGFSERHLPELFKIIALIDWKPGPATIPLSLVLGDANFAHHAWNQLSGLMELASEILPNTIQMVITQEPLGSIHQILPELKNWPVQRLNDVDIIYLNKIGALFAPVGSKVITKKLVTRLINTSIQNISFDCENLISEISSSAGPKLWLSVRTQNRTPINQIEVLTSLGNSFFLQYPDGAIIIDGFSIPSDIDQIPTYHKIKIQDVVAQDLIVAMKLCADLKKTNHNSKISVAVGLTINDSILLSQYADFYFCHHGTVQHKIGWFSSSPGIVHSNRIILESASSNWVAEQSEVAFPPYFISIELVRDETSDNKGNTLFSNLLHQQNYEIIDVNRVVYEFWLYARKFLKNFSNTILD